MSDANKQIVGHCDDPFPGGIDAPDSAQKEIARLKEQIADFEERECSACPEDVGCDEYIPVLKKHISELEAENARLKEQVFDLQDKQVNAIQLWSEKSILEQLEKNAAECERRDLCSRSSCELSYCGTRKSVEALKEKLEAITELEAEVARLKSGCGRPGHAAATSDEGTSYCLACELEGQVAKLRSV